MTSSPYIKFSFPYLVFFLIFSFILTHSFLSSVLRCHCDVKIRRALFCNVHCPWILKSLHPYILLLPLFSYLHRNSKHLKIRTTAAVLCSAFGVLGFFFFLQLRHLAISDLLLCCLLAFLSRITSPITSDARPFSSQPSLTSLWFTAFCSCVMTRT